MCCLMANSYYHDYNQQPISYLRGWWLWTMLLVGCQQAAPPLPPPPPQPVVQPPPPRVEPEPPPAEVTPAEPPPQPPPVVEAPPAPPRLEPPSIRWHERAASEMVFRRQRGMRFRIIYQQVPVTVTTRVAIMDKSGNEVRYTARRLDPVENFAGVDEFVPNATWQGGPYSVKVEYHDPQDGSWSDAIAYEIIPRE